MIPKPYSRVRAEIDLDAVTHNLDVMRSRIKGGAPICAVIKADGYGHGAVPIAHHIEGREDLWGFAVATAEEAAELRRAGVKKPVMLLGYAFPESYPELLSYDIMPCVFDLETAEELSRCAVEHEKTARVHIAVDTGMSRIGYALTKESAGEIRRIAELPGIRIEGLFSHFARADETTLEKAEEQLERYTHFLELLDKEGVEIPIRHLSNSAGIMRFPAAHFDMVRAGITLYGLRPSDEIAEEVSELKPVMRLVSHLSYVKMLPEGREISYGGTYTTKRETRVGTVPVGYADGYPRMLSGKGCVLIRGKRAPILGRVCMDQFMVDLSDIPEAERGEEVVLLGRQGEEELRAEELGAISGRFNYELVCDVNMRVPRCYMEQGRITKQVDYFR